jgi:hypothetical protein
MDAAKRKSKIVMPPVPLDSPAMKEAINKGGSVRSTVPTTVVDPNEDKLKSFTIRLYESELAEIRDILPRLPKRGVKSIRSFLTVAVQEKIAKEKKKYPK